MNPIKAMPQGVHIQLGRNPLDLCRNDDDRNVILNQNHAEMMRRGHLWPLRTVLPLVRSNSTSPSETQMGFIDRPYKCGMLEIRLGLVAAPEGRMFIYDDPEDAVAMGWRVD